MAVAQANSRGKAVAVFNEMVAEGKAVDVVIGSDTVVIANGPRQSA